MTPPADPRLLPDPALPIGPWQRAEHWLIRGQKVAEWGIAGALLVVAGVLLVYVAPQFARPPQQDEAVATIPATALVHPVRNVAPPAPKLAVADKPRAADRSRIADEPPLRLDLERQLQARVVQSTVLIVRPLERGIAFGTGTLLDKKNRLVLTNYHVARQSQKLAVYFPMYQGGALLTDFRRYIQSAAGRAQALPGRSVYAVPSRDLALVQLDWVPEQTQPLPLAAARPRPGQRVYSVGNATDAGRPNLLWTITSGSIRQFAHQKMETGAKQREPFTLDADVILTSSPIEPGDSGGPMVNPRGEMIGVTQGVLVGAQTLAVYIDRGEVEKVLRRFALEKGITLDLRTRAGDRHDVVLPAR